MVAGTAQYVQIYTPIDQYPAWEKIVHADELSPYANSPQTIDFIKSCISKCDASHPSCQRISSDLPTRLVDVGLDDLSHIRIVEAADLSGEQYLALSYCWGDGQKIMTTRANYAAMQIGFSIEDLPQTLKDAISLTRQLGHRYIWIDSLCIMQDCNGDWEHEAGTMASVYRNAYLTITANTAAAASEGFLTYQHATTEYPTPLKVPWRTEESIDTILASRVIPNSSTHVDGQEDPLPLETRGWGLQERVLSSRILSYTANELQWICQSARYCECGKISQTVTYGHSPNEMRTKMRGPVFQLTAAEAWDKWKMLVDTYSPRLLTNQEDKLPAIAGVASVIQDITGSKYIAGLWEDDLVLDLTWDTAQWGNEDMNTLPCSLEKYVAPTFSWASLPVGVSFARGSRYYMSPCKWYPECEVIDSGTELRGTNPLGHVNGGFVKLRGSMAKAELQTHTPEGRTAQGIWHVQFRAERFGFLPDTRLEEFLWSGEDGASENSVRRSPFGSEEDIIQPGAVVYIFSLGYWKAVDQGKERWHHNYLILGRSAGKTAVFERIGFCIGKKMDSGGSRGELCEEFEKVEITLV
ncbi:hypothetical protein J1614_006961 [Plenodomus biglobosus]|nr:hypothetical protein J1614_006961 [Plenodomus biglobosus]